MILLYIFHSLNLQHLLPNPHSQLPIHSQTLNNTSTNPALWVWYTLLTFLLLWTNYHASMQDHLFHTHAPSRSHFPTQALIIFPCSPPISVMDFSLYWSISINIWTCCYFFPCYYSWSPIPLHLLHHFFYFYLQPNSLKELSICPLILFILKPTALSFCPNLYTETTAYFKNSNDIHITIYQLSIFSLIGLSAALTPSFHLTLRISYPLESQPTSNSYQLLFLSLLC